MIKLIKWAFFLFCILALLTMAGIWWFNNNINDVLKQQIELQASSTLKTEVKVADVELDLPNGGLVVNHLTVANLRGFNNPYVITADSIRIGVNLRSIYKKLVDVQHVEVGKAVVNAEMIGNKINLQVMADQLNKQSNPAAQSGNRYFNDILIRVDHFNFINATLNLSSDQFGQRTLPAPDIHLADIGGDIGIPPEQLAQAFLQPLIDQLEEAVKVRLRAELENYARNKFEQERQKISDKLADKEDQVRDRFEKELDKKSDELKNKLEEKLKDLF